MSLPFKSAPALAVIIASGCFGASKATVPRVFYSDIESGPNNGGENDGGAYVTVYGAAFGTQVDSSFVTVGGAKAAKYPVWTDTRISFQLTKESATGDILVNTAGGVSNPIPFTIRPGRIRFVALNGKDGGKGTASSPWRTVLHARDAMAAGDITYVREGVAQETNDDWSSCLLLAGKSGTAGRPIALVAYPGESATIGTTKSTKDGGCDLGIRTKGQGEHFWVIAGFRLRGANEAVAILGVQDWRIVGNDMSCPGGDGPSSCFGTGQTSRLKAFGNNIHDTGRKGASALYHGVYLGTDSNHIDFGWNTIANVNGCRGLHVYSSGGKDAFDLQIHDNLIHDTQCDGIILATVDPSQPGGVNVWNNVIYNAGKGPNTPEGSGAFFCIYAQGTTNAGPPGSGTIEVFNNTMYGCGTWSKPPYGNANGAVAMFGPNPAKRLRLRNNIIYQTTNTPYILMDDGKDHLCSDTDHCARVYGSNNVFFGTSPLPGNKNITGSVRADPRLAKPASGDFHLLAGSRAATGGAPVPHATDRDGTSFAKCKCTPIGAYAATVE